MMRIIFVVACAVATVFAAESPISEPPNIELSSPDDMDNSISSLDMAEVGQDEGDCTSDTEPSSLPEKRDGEDQPAVPRCSNRNFIRFGRAGKSNFIRFGRGGKNDNFIRFGRGSKSNFIRLGRDKSDNFIRFGRGKTDNFIRLGRGKTDNFIRLGRGKSDNFIRFGRGKPENFIRFGRGKPDNFIRFGRGMKDNFVRFGRDEISELEDTELSPEEEILRDIRGGKSDSNFIRFGRGKDSNFIRLGRGNYDDLERDERSKGSNNFLRLGRNLFGDDDEDEEFVRLSRSGSSNDLRRGKLTDRNFIRLGRSSQQNEDSNTDSARSGRSANNRNFIRLGKRTRLNGENESLLRFGRDVEQIDEVPVLSGSESSQSDAENKTSKDEFQHSRNKRAINFASDDDTPEDSSDYPAMIGSNSYDEMKLPAEDIRSPFRYYSPLTSGIPNYILGPEPAVLAPLSNGAESSLSKRAKGRDHSKNYIRLG